MAIDFEADLLHMMQDFGTPVAYGARTFTAIFDQAAEVTGGLDAGVVERMPRLTCRESDLAGVKLRHTLTVRGRDYRVERLLPDGTGAAEVYLHLLDD